MQLARPLQVGMITVLLAGLGAPAASACTDASLEAQYAAATPEPPGDAGQGSAPAAATAEATPPPVTPAPAPTPATKPAAQPRPQPAQIQKQVARPQAQANRTEVPRRRAEQQRTEAATPQRQARQPVAVQSRPQNGVRRSGEPQSSPIARRATADSGREARVRGEGPRRVASGGSTRSAGRASRSGASPLNGPRRARSSPSVRRQAVPVDRRLTAPSAEPRTGAEEVGLGAVELVMLASALLATGAGGAAVLARRRRPAPRAPETRAALETEAALQEIIAEERARASSKRSDAGTSAGSSL